MLYQVETFNPKTYDKAYIKYRFATEIVSEIAQLVPNMCDDITSIAEIYKKIVTEQMVSDEWIDQAKEIVNIANNSSSMLKNTTISTVQDLKEIMDTIETENRRMKSTIEDKKGEMDGILASLGAITTKTISAPSKPQNSSIESPTTVTKDESTSSKNEEKDTDSIDKNSKESSNPEDANSDSNTKSSNESTNVVPQGEPQYNGGVMQMPMNGDIKVTSKFGNRNAPTAGASTNHKGVDLAGPYGSAIKTIADGEVVKSGFDAGGYGNYVEIKHVDLAGNEYYTLYAHMKERNVEVGDVITKNTQIGVQGSTGVSTGDHLHFEVRMSQKGDQIDPLPYLYGEDN